MVTQNPTDNFSPHKQTRVWKPKPAVEGVPSMFAHATLSKPLKVNRTVTGTVTVNVNVPVTKADKDKDVSATTSSVVSQKSNKESKDSIMKPLKPLKPTEFKRKPANSVTTAKPVVTASKAPSTTSISDAAATATANVKAETKRSTKSKPTLVIGGCSTVAGIPQSWPKPHAVPATEKMATTRKSLTSSQEDEQQQLHKNIDHLIPEMYRKKSAKQLEKEQQEEIQLMREIMWELRQQEIAREEEAMRCKPISNDVEATLNALRTVKKVNDMLDDHSSLDDSNATPKRPSAYSTHVQSKLAFFNSNHSVSLKDSDSDDSSSVSSWNSDDSDGLFRG